MSDADNSAKKFLRRWSALKRAAATRAPHGVRSQSWEDEKAEPRSEVLPPAFDPTTLPSIDSIAATRDIRPFLAPGVPKELARAALRRLWVIDPTIRDFIGLAESQWDFTRPDSIPGFGALEQLTPELRRIAADLFSEAPAPVSTQRSINAPSDGQVIGAAVESQATSAATTERNSGNERISGEGELIVGHGVRPDEVGSPHAHCTLDPADRSGESRQRSPRKHGSAVPKL